MNWAGNSFQGTVSEYRVTRNRIVDEKGRPSRGFSWNGRIRWPLPRKVL